MKLSVIRDIYKLCEQLEAITPAMVNGEECEQCKHGDCCDYDCNAMELTVATTDGTSWSYQTGDNSFTGGAYSFQHWSVKNITPMDSKQERREIARDIVSELAECMDIH